jgi:hypothetical protein
MGTKLKRLLAGSAALVCAALAGCGTATVGANSPLSVAVDKGTNPQQQARADAAAMLAAFVPPPGATRLSSAPAGSGGILKHKAFTVGINDQLDDASFWRVPGPAGSVLAFEKAHLPRQFTLSQWGSVGDTFTTPAKPGHPIMSSLQPRPIGNTYGAWEDTWALPGVPGVIALRELTVEVTDPSSSVTYVRVDSNVAWIPVRPASEKVPAGVTAVTITASPDMNHPKGTPAPVTVTDPAKVAKIVALLDGLSLNTSGVHGCLMEQGQDITLSFRAKPGGPVLATASEPIPSCGGVDFAIGGVQQPGLADWGTFPSKVLAIVGVHWPSWYL